MRLVLVGALALSMRTAPAIAQEWTAISEGRVGIHYVDRTSIRRTSDDVRFRYQIRFNQAQTVGDGLRFDRMTNLIAAHCSRMSYRVEQRALHLGAAVVVGLGPTNEGTEYTTEGTNMHAVLFAVCSGRLR